MRIVLVREKKAKGLRKRGMDISFSRDRFSVCLCHYLSIYLPLSHFSQT